MLTLESGPTPKIPNYPFNTFSIILHCFNAMIHVMEVVFPLPRSLCVLLVMDATTVLVFNVFIAAELPTLTVSPCDTRFCLFTHAYTPHIQFLTAKKLI